MLQKKGSLDPADDDMILASDLVDEQGDWWSLTFKKAIDEQLQGEYFERCEYSIELTPEGKKLMEFIGWTPTKVVFNLRGMFRDDSFLSSVPRHPK